MNTKTIIAVIPACYSTFGAFATEPNKQLFVNICSGKKSALTFPTPLDSAITSEILNGEVNDELQKSIFGVNNYIEVAQIFWNQILDIKSVQWEVFDYQKNLIEGLKLELSAIKESALVKKNFYMEKAFYVQLFDRALFFYFEVLKNNTEVIVTDFSTAHCLNYLKPGEFDIINHCPDDFPANEVAKVLLQEFADYKIFTEWDSDSKPLLAGIWDTLRPEHGQFELYCVPEPRIGKVKGIISDKYGLASFTGELDHHQMTFTKKYLTGAIQNNSDAIDNEPIFYTLWLNLNEGEYWREVKGARVGIEPCLITDPINWVKIGLA